MLMNEIPMDSLMALAEERRRRYTGEAERFRLARFLTRSRRARRRDARHREVDGGADAAGTRVTAAGHDLCA
ncbi:hypothetical protein [Pseudonocardia sp. KRD291]|uniref:hypothetical protein n=1 Tax=Pseudonocardia sp. KRD291 TaxID=2792007 RepID=UPI001C4A6BD5|nr:hypothetical protein [Pseudonocardia sp. KRD291]MBW0102311.1 hypothetical protein [Pseudonocardia sp. KRD291]